MFFTLAFHYGEPGSNKVRRQKDILIAKVISRKGRDKCVTSALYYSKEVTKKPKVQADVKAHRQLFGFVPHIPTLLYDCFYEIRVNI